MEIIYCAGNNPRFDQAAKDAGFLLGLRLPGTTYHPVYFADQEYKSPDRAAYMAALEKHRPQRATVLDWERPAQFCEVMGWAEEAAQYVESVIIIPKVIGEVRRVPLYIGGKPVILGYSVPTSYGGTPCDLWEFAGRDVHLLGGSPHEQMRIWQECSAPFRLSLWDAPPRIVSADGNMHNHMAVRHNRFWVPKNRSVGNQWPTLRESEEAEGREKWGKDAPYEAFRRSCQNIMEEWQRLKAVPELNTV